MKSSYVLSLFRNTIFLLLFTSISFQSKAQYQSLIDTSHQWNVMHCYWGWATSCHTEYLKPGSDTVINSMNYTKLMTFDSLFSSAQWNDKGYLREDTASQKVYFLDLALQSEQLLYDFSVAVGDTIVSPYPVQCHFVISGIDTVNIMNVSRRRIAMQSLLTFQTEVWLTGIGNIRGLLENGTNSCMTDYSSSLLCFHEGSTLKYQDSTTTACYYSTIGIKEHLQSIDHTIYPNPGAESCKIEFYNSSFFPTSLVVYNRLGETVLSDRTTGNNFKLPLRDLSSGIYFYRIANEKGWSSGKLVKE